MKVIMLLLTLLVTKLIKWSELLKLTNTIIFYVLVKKKKLKEPLILETEIKENQLENSQYMKLFNSSKNKYLKKVIKKEKSNKLLMKSLKMMTN